MPEAPGLRRQLAAGRGKDEPHRKASKNRFSCWRSGADLAGPAGDFHRPERSLLERSALAGFVGKHLRGQLRGSASLRYVAPIDKILFSSELGGNNRGT